MVYDYESIYSIDQTYELMVCTLIVLTSLQLLI